MRRGGDLPTTPTLDILIVSLRPIRVLSIPVRDELRLVGDVQAVGLEVGHSVGGPLLQAWSAVSVMHAQKERTEVRERKRRESGDKGGRKAYAPSP